MNSPRSLLPSATPTSSRLCAMPAPDVFPASGAGFLPVSSDFVSACFSGPIQGCLHPESEYDERHANYLDGDLRAVPDFALARCSRYGGAQ